MDVEEIWTSIKATLYERTASPLASTFIMSWGVVNYKFFVILFSGESVEKKFQLFETHVFSAGLNGIQNLLAVPLVATAFFIFVYPYASRPVYGWWLTQRGKLEETRYKSERTRRLTLEESQKIIRDAEVMRQDYSSQLETLDAANRALRERIQELELSKNPPKEPSQQETIEATKDNEKRRTPKRNQRTLNQSTADSGDIESRKYFERRVPEGTAREVLYRIVDSKSGGFVEELFGDSPSQEILSAIKELSNSQLIHFNGSGQSGKVMPNADGKRAATVLRS